MTTTRSDYKLTRNSQIYDEYISQGTSLNTLAKKYNLSPQRVRFIVTTTKLKGLTSKLAPTDTAETRDKVKNQAVMLREQGKLDLAFALLDQVITWDEANNNLRGKMDILGHQKLVLTLMADTTSNKQKKRQFLAKAVTLTQEALNLAETIPNLPEGAKSIQKVHMASLLIKQDEFLEEPEQSEPLTRALALIDTVLPNFPGSEAHKAWPLGLKAMAQHKLNQDLQAIETLSLAQACLYKGYEAELKSGDQANLKLRIWNSGLMLGFAKIYAETNKPLLAEVYASAVLHTPDPDKTMVARKREARKLLVQLRVKG